MECQSLRYLSKQDMLVPCGKCAFCTASKRSDWALRLHYEGKMHSVKKFVTLTYADAHLKWDRGQPQLCKRDLQLWFKRVRKAGAKFRYYAVGEYGSKTYRPHYHVLVFGNVSDEILRDSWHCGLVHIGTVTDASIMYCLGYIVGGKGWQMRLNRVPPFSLMSRRPGLGVNYLSKDMVDWHKSDRKNYSILNGERRHLPRYYKTKIFSKIDLVRIAVRDQKNMFKAAVKWVRSPSMRKHPDPIGYRKEQCRRAAQRILSKTKQNLII